MTEKRDVAADKGKVLSIRALFFTAVAITVLGALFCVYSAMFAVNVKVVNTQVSGVIFGAVALYLGIWYIIRVGKLKKKLFESRESFSWNNFKRSRK